jgi:hypothetical protein
MTYLFILPTTCLDAVAKELRELKSRRAEQKRGGSEST